MTDLEITKLCAEAMGLHIHHSFDDSVLVQEFVCEDEQASNMYFPLRNDAQAMALVKKFPYLVLDELYRAIHPSGGPVRTRIANGEAPDLNRAICECVAKMQVASQLKGADRGG